MLPEQVTFEEEAIGKLLQPLTDQEKSYLRDAPERIKRRRPSNPQLPPRAVQRS